MFETNFMLILGISRNVGVAREKREPSADEEWPDLTDPITEIWTSPKPQSIITSIVSVLLSVIIRDIQCI